MRKELWYEVEIRLNYLIETDNIDKVIESMEFPLFPSVAEDCVELDGNRNTWKQIQGDTEQYELQTYFVYHIKTNNIDKVLNTYEHPVFPDLDDKQVSFIDGWTNADELQGAN